MKKNYILDTNAIFEDLGECIEVLRNGHENKIYIPKTVIDELDKLKGVDHKKHLVSKIVSNLLKYQDHFEILNDTEYDDSPDNQIIREIQKLKDDKKYTFITNDKLLTLKALKEGIDTEKYKASNPYKNEVENYTGFVDLYTEEGKKEDLGKNTFHFNEKGQLKFYSSKRNEIESVPEKEV